MKTLRIVMLLGLLVWASNAIAIDQQGGGGLILANPTGDFGEALGGDGYGLDLHYGLRPSSSLTLGVGLQGMIYGSETQTFSMPLVEDFDLTTTNNLAGGFLFAQWRPLTGAVQPYVEARIGFNYIWTESKLEDRDWWDDEQVARQTNYDDFASFWGGGGGVLIRLREGNRRERTPGVFLDLKVSTLMGSEAEYLTEGDIEIVDNVPVFHASQSETDMTTYELGVVVTF